MQSKILKLSLVLEQRRRVMLLAHIQPLGGNPKTNFHPRKKYRVENSKENAWLKFQASRALEVGFRRVEVAHHR